MRRASIGRFRAFLVLLSTVALVATLPSVNAAGILVGQVIGDDINSNEIPLGGAKVAVYANGTLVLSMVAAWDGTYSIFLPPGVYVVTVERPGFNAQSRVVRITDGRLTRLNFHLQRAPDITGNTFDFGLSSGGPIMVLTGELGWTAIQVALRSGSPQNVSLSVSGLPSGASASLSPSVDSPSFTSICIITTSFATPVGSYVVTVSGVGGGLTGSTSFTLTISPRAHSPDIS